MRTPTQRLAGELVAVDADSVHVLLADGALTTVAKGEVTRARIAYATNRAGYYAGWGAGGTLSTLSHGWGLILSAPLWVLTTTASAVAESRVHRRTYPQHGWDAFAPYARFPQGLPAELSRPEIRPKP